VLAPTLSAKPAVRIDDEIFIRKIVYGVIAFCAIGAFVYWARHEPIALLTGLPIIASVFAYYFIQYGAGAAWRQVKHNSLASRSGNTYVFEGKRIGMRFENKQCFVNAADVMGAMGKPNSKSLISAMAIQKTSTHLIQDSQGVWWFTELGVMQWILPQAATFDHQARRLQQWLQRDVFRPGNRR
jgi:hypothetical protein